MTWFKLDDRFFDNPKISALSDRAVVAYLEAGTYCARELTDGFVPTNKARAIARTPRALKELVPGLWEPVGGGFMVHDYLVYNPTREQVLATKQTRSEAGSKGAANRWQGVKQIDSKEDGKDEAPLPVTPSSPAPKHPPPRALRPTRVVAVAFEQCFGRLLSPMELEQVKALEEEHPKERIEYALREAAALNKRSVRYVQRTCERMASDGDNTERRSPANAGAATTPASSLPEREFVLD